MPFQGLSNVLTPLEASRVLARAEFRMRPAHDVALAAGVEICKQEKCSHFIQPKDLIDGGLRNILVPSDYDVLTSVSNVFIDQKVFIPKESITLCFKYLYIQLYSHIFRMTPLELSSRMQWRKLYSFQQQRLLKTWKLSRVILKVIFFFFFLHSLYGRRMFETLNSQSDSHSFVYLHFQLSNLNKISSWLNLQRQMSRRLLHHLRNILMIC